MVSELLPTLEEGGLIAVVVILLLGLLVAKKLQQGQGEERKEAQKQLFEMQEKTLEAAHTMSTAIANNTEVMKQVLNK